ncbi:MAG: hypothetical protein JO040_12340 [Gemmatimonadetes bacterium]|nr:hypothetical protein [Gemmatimonadota bacterium]
MSGPLTDQQRAQLGRVRASSEHLLGLVNEILDLAKVESGRIRVRSDRLPVRGAVLAALALVGPQAASREIRIRDGSDCQPGLAYCGDEDRVRQVLVNLLSNAVKFTPPGGEVQVACSVTERADPEAHLASGGEWLRVDVRDTGIGIPRERLASVFEPFVQVESGYTRESGGTGLGLTISRQLARLMGGDLTARSRSGEGSCFTLWLPLAPEEHPGREQEPAWMQEVRSVRGLTEVGRIIARRADAVVRTLGDQLHADPQVPVAAGMNRAQLEDHTSTFLVDIGLALVTLDEGGGEPELMQDGSDIQRIIAHRHGAQRARLGWKEADMRREFALLRAEVERTVRREVPQGSHADVDRALEVFERLLEQAERISVESLAAYAGEEEG